jgi:hypothetical protein
MYEYVLKLAYKDLGHKKQHPYGKQHHCDSYQLNVCDLIVRIEPEYEHIIYTVLTKDVYDKGDQTQAKDEH